MSANIRPNAVLKVRVNEKESWRRIPLHRLMKDRSENAYNTNVSFEKLCKYAILYSGLGSGKHVDDNILCNFEFQLTYTDEEGDQVQISTDEELIDAMLWKQEYSDVLHILASVKAKARASDPTISPEDDRSYKSKPVLDLVDAIFSFVAGTVEIIRDEIKVTKNKSAEKSSEDAKTDGDKEDMSQDDSDRDELSFDPNFVHIRHTCDGCGTSPITGHRYSATNIPDFDLCVECKNKCALSDISFVKAQDGVGDVPTRYEGFGANFIHSRHTCDGCGTSPICGYRWHATNIPNYDLCHKCKSKTVATDVFFQLAQHKPDKRFSFHEKKSFWKNRRCSRSCQNVNCGTDTDSGDVVLSMNIPEDLKLSIEQSLEELKNRTKDIVEKQESVSASDLSDHGENAQAMEEVFASEAKEEPTKLSESDYIQINKSLVSTGTPIESEDIEKALFEASISSAKKPTELDYVQSKEDEVKPKDLSSSDLIKINESLVSSGKPVEDEEVEKAFFEASITTQEEESVASNVIQSTMKQIVASLASEEMETSFDISAPSITESIASEEPTDVKMIADALTLDGSSTEIAISSISPSLAAEVISMDDLEHPMENGHSETSIDNDSFVSSTSSNISFQDVGEISCSKISLDASSSDQEVVVKIPVPTSDIISLKTSDSDLSLTSNEENESANAKLKQSENSASFVSAAEKEVTDSDSVSSATNASLSSEDSWNFVEENVHENIGSLLFQKGLN